jgi:hypothetical protein
MLNPCNCTEPMYGAWQCLPNLVRCGMHQIEAVDGIQQIVVGTIQ